MCTAAFKVEELSFEGMMLFIYKEHIVPLQFEQCLCVQEAIQHPPFEEKRTAPLYERVWCKGGWVKNS